MGITITSDETGNPITSDQAAVFGVRIELQVNPVGMHAERNFGPVYIHRTTPDIRDSPEFATLLVEVQTFAGQVNTAWNAMVTRLRAKAPLLP